MRSFGLEAPMMGSEDKFGVLFIYIESCLLLSTTQEKSGGTFINTNVWWNSEFLGGGGLLVWGFVCVGKGFRKQENIKYINF